MNYIETFSTDPHYNLAFEEYIFTHKLHGEWLMLWQNNNAVIVGLNQNTEEEINRDYIEKNGVAVVRRMTGGGAVYHDLGNLNYSFIADACGEEQLSLPRFTGPVCRALKKMGAEAVLSGRNDVLIDGKKVSGVAQRVSNGRVLHHGTLLFNSDAEKIAAALHADPAKYVSKSSKSVRSRVGNIKDFVTPGLELVGFWDRLLPELAADGLERRRLSAVELAQVEFLANSKYRTWEWNYGRNPECDVKNRARYPGGTLEVQLSVKNGLIEDAAFFGDFMAVTGNEPIVTALKGVRYEKNAIESALSSVNIAPAFGGITREEVLKTILT